ncbi:MAG: hypothetical protein WA064_00695 [Candidatus Moraniibacteriota bacterium]
MGKDNRIERIEELIKEKGASFKIDSELWMEKKPKEEEKIDFFCLCGSRECVPHRKSNEIYGPGGRSWIVYYSCAGCTNHLDDPKKYSEAQRAIEKRLQDMLRLTKIF